MSAELERRVLVSLPAVEHCTACDEDFEEHELYPHDNDLCPKCGKSGTMTTLYGHNVFGERLRGYELSDLAGGYEHVEYEPSIVRVFEAFSRGREKRRRIDERVGGVLRRIDAALARGIARVSELIGGSR